MNKHGKLILISLFITYIFIIGIYLMLTPDNAKSNTENREMAQKPNLSYDSFGKGTFMKEFEDYFTDQFPGRDVWLKSYLNYQRMVDKTYVNGFYITEDNWILNKPVHTSYKNQIDLSTNKVNEFGKYLKKKDIDFYYFSAPHKASMFREMLPDYIERGNELKSVNYFMSNLDKNVVTSLDMVEKFKKNFTLDELKDMYFQTDHHWNIYGAFEGYKMIVDVLDKNGLQKDKDKYVDVNSYKKECISPNKLFLGSTNRQLYMAIKSDDNKDMCTLTNREIFLDYEVRQGNKKVKPFDLYARALDDENNNIIDYGEIFTNNKREINIVNNKNRGRENILIIKDSYANPIIYHIAQHFYKTTVYDPRHNKDRTIKDFIDKEDFDSVAILYNSSHLRGVNYNFFDLPK
ncbi:MULTISPECIES: hypothetical protein [Clostridia]|uniref:alginate O-acetyltransferase AlgX-related protein n=1 Tax=Clostridia TaxID=186801 RepID=UPI000EA3F5AB|nr:MULTISPECIES: hypothetical protein [Clostridia]NBJ68812.1 hypothetical protein [Roseburia sp. 1XD42-34]RKI80191.1 hypothetical protein D7V87_04890 [Clostridium sp. 1xD42-85]